jgi:tetratricopeptide (TPR) repeat protein
LNLLGSAYRQIEDTSKAEEYFKKSIQAEPTDHRPYLDLINLYRLASRFDEADQVVKAGLQVCRQVQELRILKAAFSKRQTVSACLMVKNEEELLGGCLESIRDWVDEIIVVDTGSTDRTVQIAQSYGAKVFHQPWEGNFSKHRNYSMEQATCDWVFIIDADEQMYAEDIPDLLPFLEDARIKAISLNVLNVYGDNEERQVFLLSPRLFRRDLNARYDGIVHNQVRLPDSTPALRTGVRLKHFGYDLSPEKMSEKVQRSRELLEKQLKEDPDNAFAMFNLAQLLRAGSDECPEESSPEIIRLASRAVELTHPDKLGERHIHLMCLDQLAWIHFYLEEHDRALEYCRRALQHKSNYLDPLLLIGHIYMGKGEYDVAINHYQTYLNAQAVYDPTLEVDEIIFQHIDSRTAVYCNLGLVAYERQDMEAAKTWLHKTLELDLNYPSANGWLGRAYLQEDNPAEAEKYLLKHLEVGSPITDEPLLLANLYLKRDDRTNAEIYLLKAREIDPADMSVILKLGRLYAETDREEEAKKNFEQAIELVGDDPQDSRKLAETLQKLGRYSEAVQVYERLLETAQSDPQILNDLANCHYHTEQFAEAERRYQEALSCELAPAIAYRNLGLTQARLHKEKEAVASLEQYLKLYPEDDEMRRIIGDLYSQQRDFGSALDNYEKYLAGHPQDKMAIFSLSECYLLMGHTDSAILGYRRVLLIDKDFELARQRLTQLSERVEGV